MSRSVWLAGVAAAVLAASPLAGAASKTDATTLIAAGDEALARFDLPQAAFAYQNALEFDPKSYDACWRLARAAVDACVLETAHKRKKQLLVEAQGYARSAVKFNANDAKGHTFLAVVVGQLALYEGGRAQVELSKEVKTEAEKAIALNAKEDLAYHCLGVWNREMVELNWFLKKLAEAIYGKFPPASMDDALTNLRQAAELAPTNVAHQVELGITFAAAGKNDEARKTLEHALTMPKTWVTDDVYKEKARKTLKSVH